MTKLIWDKIGERTYETGVDRAVLYIPDAAGVYNKGYAWNGITAATESPSGAEPTPLYADNIKYLNLTSAEEFGLTIEAFMYPVQFGQCDGTASPTPGLQIGQQGRRPFGLSYRTLKGNDLESNDYGYKLHLVYGAMAAPSERSYATVNDSPEAITFSWELTTTAVDIPDTNFKPTAILTIDSTEVEASVLAALEVILYGSAATQPRLPMPAEVIELLQATEVTPVAPTQVGNVVTIPTVLGVAYLDAETDTVVTGTITITKDTTIRAVPEPGYNFPSGVVGEWLFTHA